MSYLRDPAEIYRASWRAVAAATDLAAVPAELHDVALRLVHAAADPSLAGLLRASPGAVAAGRAALAAGAPILVDAEMVASGITQRLLKADNPVRCLLNDPAVPDLARRLMTTRAAAAVELWRPWLAGAVVAIGNAPTALFRLLELLDDGAPRPALVVGCAVGFIGAAEAKAALMAQDAVPWIALEGRRGGSALAAAAVNALAAGAGRVE
ncbi:MAG: precorrin-8X methylmutase [Proteobacteria bacterium]|nr:precorrin-8X methylmutase [Pseudomonadota bacterium]